MTAFASSDTLGEIIDRVDLGIVVVDRNLNVLLWNQFMAMNSGEPADTVEARNLLERFPDLPGEWLRRKIEGVFLLKNFAFTSWEQRPYLFRFPHRRPITGSHVDFMYQNCTFIPTRNQAGEVESVCIVVQDATDEGISKQLLRETLHQLELSSRVDGLTQLYNRVHWEARLHEEFARVKRYGGLCSLIMFDLDHFKAVNDTHGHLIGDHVLREVGRRVVTTLRDMDVAGRYGGEEFGVILPGTDRVGAEQLAERLRVAMAEPPFQVDGLTLYITISLGIVLLDAELPNHEKCLAQADAALYQSKIKGRNTWTYFTG